MASYSTHSASNNNNNIEQTVQNYRYQYQTAGGNITRIKYDIQNLINRFRTLRLQGGTFTFPNGKSASLLNLVGTVPITFQGSQYNIPVQIWISERYPATAPICYVTPTADMVVTPRHNNIQSDGKVVYFLDLDRWNNNSSNLVNLVISLCNMFGRHPPCQAKPTGYGANNYSSNTPATQQYGSSNYRNQSIYGNSGNDRVMYNNSSYQPTMFTDNNRNNPPPSYNNVTNNLTRENLYGRSDSNNNSTLAGHHSSSGDTLAGHQSSNTSNSGGDNYSRLNNRVQKEVEKVLKKRQTQLNDALNMMETLDAGSNKLKVGLKTLKEQENTLQGYIETTKNKNANIAEWLVENENTNTKNVDPDEVMLSGDVWSDQIFDQVATISAIDDTLFELDDALKKGVIELNPFLRAVRNLASQQFQAKALAMKICEMQSQMMLSNNYNVGRRNSPSNSNNNNNNNMNQGHFSTNNNNSYSSSFSSSGQGGGGYSGYPKNFRK